MHIDGELPDEKVSINYMVIPKIVHYYKKYLPRWAKSINRDSFWKRLGTTVTVNPALTEAVLLPVSVNQKIKRKKKPGKTILGPPSPSPPCHPHRCRVLCQQAPRPALVCSSAAAGRRPYRLCHYESWAPSPPTATIFLPVASCKLKSTYQRPRIWSQSTT